MEGRYVLYPLQIMTPPARRGYVPCERLIMWSFRIFERPIGSPDAYTDTLTSRFPFEVALFPVWMKWC